MNHYVYKFTHLGDEFPKCYIGKRSCKGPIEEDKYYSSGSQQKDIRTNPWKYKKEILGTYDTEEEAYGAEARFCTALHVKTGMFYNINQGGISPPRMVGKHNPFYGKKHTKESRKKISEAGRKRGPITEETRRKLSEAAKGENNPFYGKKHTEDALRKMRAAKKDVFKGENHPMYGKKHTEDSIDKNRKNQKTRVPICINNIWYDSVRQGAEAENINRVSLRYAIKNNKKTVTRRIDKKVFTLDY